MQNGDASHKKSAIARAGSIRLPSPGRRPKLTPGKIAHGDAVDEGEDEEVLARDMRQYIIAEIKREQAEDAKQRKIEEINRKTAVQAFQMDIRDKFAQIQVGLDETRGRLDKAFGAAVDEKQVNEFLEEQRSQQVQTELGAELGDMLLKFGIGPSLRPDATGTDVPANVEEPGTRDTWRRYVFAQSWRLFARCKLTA